MQKPILSVFEDKDIILAQEKNLDSAINLAVFLHYNEVNPIPLKKLFETLCNFSYKGDIRMRWKMENPNKVMNIVEGSYDGLLDLYTPRLEKLGTLKDDCIILK
jgi:hypothetical protein